MIELNGTTYYSKADICERFKVALATINVRVSKKGLKGTQIGRFKYYTESEISTMFDAAPVEK